MITEYRNLFKHIWHPQLHIFIRESNDLIPQRIQFLCALFILVFYAGVRITIHFDDQAMLYVAKINDVAGEWMLPSKL